MKKDENFIEWTENIKNWLSSTFEDRIDDINNTTDFLVNLWKKIISFFANIINLSKKWFKNNYKKWPFHILTFSLLYIYLVFVILWTLVFITTFWKYDLNISNIVNYRINNTINEFIQKQITDNSIFNLYNNSDYSEYWDKLKDTSFYLLDNYRNAIINLSDEYIYSKEHEWFDWKIQQPTQEYIDFIQNKDVIDILANNSNIKTNKIEILNIIKDSDLDITKTIVKWVALVNNDKINYIWEINLKYIWIKEWYFISSYKFIQICWNKIQENIKNKCN